MTRAAHWRTYICLKLGKKEQLLKFSISLANFFFSVKKKTNVKYIHFHTLIVLIILKPVAAVDMRTPGSCLCQCNSLISVCPYK